MLDSHDIASFDRLVTIETRSSSRDSTYNQAENYTYTELGSFWMKIINKGGSEKQEEDKEQPIRKRRFLVRYEDELISLQENDRIIEDGQTWEITNCDFLKREGHIYIDCEYRVTTPLVIISSATYDTDPLTGSAGGIGNVSSTATVLPSNVEYTVSLNSGSDALPSGASLLSNGTIQVALITASAGSSDIIVDFEDSLGNIVQGTLNITLS